MRILFKGVCGGGDASKVDTWHSIEELRDSEHDASRLPDAPEF